MEGRWISAEPAAVFAGCGDFALLNTFDATRATLIDVTFWGALACDSALPAADFCEIGAEGFVRTLDAECAAFAPVTSVFRLFAADDCAFAAKLSLETPPPVLCAVALCTRAAAFKVIGTGALRALDGLEVLAGLGAVLVAIVKSPSYF